MFFQVLRSFITTEHYKPIPVGDIPHPLGQYLLKSSVPSSGHAVHSSPMLQLFTDEQSQQHMLLVDWLLISASSAQMSFLKQPPNLVSTQNRLLPDNSKPSGQMHLKPPGVLTQVPSAHISGS